MVCLMEGQGLMQYIDGTISPPQKDHNDYKVWKRNDALVEGWILGSLSDQIASTVLGWNSAYDVWDNLERMHGPYVNASRVVSKKLQWRGCIPRTNYETWKAEMVFLIMQENEKLMDYIDGRISGPPEKEHKDYNDWKRNYALIKGWILGSLDDEIASTVLGLDSAKDIWDKLEDMYGPEGKVPPPLSCNTTSLAAVNIASFVPAKLQWLSGIADTNYESWREAMLCLIESQGLMEYIGVNSSYLLLGPSPGDDVQTLLNAIVKGWIIGSLSDQIASTVVKNGKSGSAYDIWKYLEETFGPRKAGDGKWWNYSMPLNRAALDGNWEAAKQIFINDPNAKDWVARRDLIPLHIAVSQGKKAMNFVINLVQMLNDDDDLVRLRDVDNSTALHYAAMVGNKEAAAILVARNLVTTGDKLCNIANTFQSIPIHEAARYGHREVVEYLIPHTSIYYGLDPFSIRVGQQVVVYLIQSEYFDIALRLAETHPKILQITDFEIESPLTLLTIQMSKRKLNNIWEQFISLWIAPLETNARLDSTVNRTDDTEAGIANAPWLDLGWMLCKCSTILVPPKLKAHQQAHQLLKRMCEEIASQDIDEANKVFKDAIFLAAKLNVRDVVDTIIKAFSGAVYFEAIPSGQHIFHSAIENRSADVFNLIYEMGDEKCYFTSHWKDNNGNNLLHLAGKLAPLHKLNEISGAALQMQCEIQWFQEVERNVHPYSGQQLNEADKTPKIVFTEEHSKLKKSGEKWMRDTTNSFALVAVLIATVMFSGAITVPGGNKDDEGFPVFSKDPAFIVFAISDAASLFSSATSLLLFIAILTSRYAEDDFLYSLPGKLMFGLAALFLSVISMIISFIATLYLVFGQKRQWVLFPLLLFACMPVASFVFHQYPLLQALFFSTYRRKILGKKSNREFSISCLFM